MTPKYLGMTGYHISNLLSKGSEKHIAKFYLWECLKIKLFKDHKISDDKIYNYYITKSTNFTKLIDKPCIESKYLHDIPSKRNLMNPYKWTRTTNNLRKKWIKYIKENPNVQKPVLLVIEEVKS